VKRNLKFQLYLLLAGFFMRDLRLFQEFIKSHNELIFINRFVLFAAEVTVTLILTVGDCSSEYRTHYNEYPQEPIVEQLHDLNLLKAEVGHLDSDLGNLVRVVFRGFRSFLQGHSEPASKDAANRRTRHHVEER